MTKDQIVFTGLRTAELLKREYSEPTGKKACIKMEYTVVSGGTERSCLLGSANTSGKFPMSLGYCGIGTIVSVGENVEKLKVGDRVLVYHGNHASYNVIDEDSLTKVDDPGISSLEASFVIIAAMGLGGVRKLELEIGESAMVMGQGLLGIFSTQFCRLCGTDPLIAADLNPARRELALKLGADYALDPSKPDFVDSVKEITGGRGINGCVEVTGVSAAMKQALECASYMGRISLLGCTRVSDTAVDYYQQVHRPGVKLIGAHNFVRPKFESYPHHWTHHDDCRAILRLIASGKIQVSPIISRVVEPEDATQIYTELCDDPQFPIGTVFDWRKYE